jgi:hypothetical protein
VGRVERDQGETPVLDPPDDRLAGLGLDLGLPHVPPPDQHIAMVEHIVPEPLAGIVEADRADREAWLLAEVGGDLVPEEVRVRHLLRRLLLVPNDHSEG